jgi:hypothetical protein
VSQKLLQKILSREGYSSEIARDGVEVVEKLHHGVMLVRGFWYVCHLQWPAALYYVPSAIDLLVCHSTISIVGDIHTVVYTLGG